MEIKEQKQKDVGLNKEIVETLIKVNNSSLK